MLVPLLCRAVSSTVCAACEPGYCPPPVVTQYMPRMLRVTWNPPRSNGSRITQVLLHRQQVSVDWVQELKRDTPSPSVVKADADDPDVEVECAARRMHPDAVSVLRRMKHKDAGWNAVPLSDAVQLGTEIKPRPTPDEYITLPVASNGDKLLPNRPYITVIIDKLTAESFHRFRLRFSNARGFSKWSKASFPCEVFADWPDVIDKAPSAVARSPFTLFLHWKEPAVGSLLARALSRDGV